MLSKFIDWAKSVDLSLSTDDRLRFVSRETRVAFAAYIAGARYQRYLDTRIIEGEKVLLTHV